MPSQRPFALALAIAVALAPFPAAAHDFFLLPSSFNATDAQLRVAATVGSAFPTPEIVVTPDRVAAVAARAAAGARQVTIAGAKDKALDLTLSTEGDGPVVVGVALKPRDVDYGDDRIDLILSEYHVSTAAKAAVAALPRPRTLKVDSRRFAKTMVCKASCAGVASIPAHGFELEFVPTASGRFKLLEAGSALAGYPVTVATADGKRSHVATDAKGEVALPAQRSGPVMLFASTMATPSAAGERFILRLTSLTTEPR